MRLYEGKRFERQLGRRFRRHAETRDGIVWEIDENSKIVQCKIQGSDEYILCHYPRNWQTLPSWCKRGNAVRITHKGGMRSYFEVTGNGRSIPSPVEGPTLPNPEILYNGILTGGLVETAEAPLSCRALSVGATTYRINGVTYTLDMDGGLSVMDDGNLGLMDSASWLMDTGGNLYPLIDAAPVAPLSRYDLLVVGTDGLIDIIKGVASTSPVMPNVPADHIKLASVLVLGDEACIEDKYIDSLYEDRKLTQITYEISQHGAYVINENDEFEWLPDSHDYPECHLTVTLRDQYGWPLLGDYTLTLTKWIGTGEIYSSQSGWDADSVSQWIFASSSYEFSYKRDQSESPEITPILAVTVEGFIEGGAQRIQLLNVAGGKIP